MKATANFILVSNTFAFSIKSFYKRQNFIYIFPLFMYGNNKTGDKMSFFAKSYVRNYENKANHRSSRSFLSCRSHRVDYQGQNGTNRQFTPKNISLEDTDLIFLDNINIHEIANTQIQQEIENRNNEINSLVCKIKAIDQISTKRIENILRNGELLNELTKEVVKKKYISLISSIALVNDLASLIKEKQLSFNNICHLMQENYTERDKKLRESNKKNLTPELDFSIKGHSDSIGAIAVSPCKSFIASGSDDSTIKIWNSSTGKLLATLNGHSCMIRSVSFNASSDLLLSSSEDKTAKIWNNMKCLMTYNKHSSAVESAAFSPDSQYVVSGCTDSTIHIWSTNSGSTLYILREHSDSVRKVMFMDNENLVVSAGQDKKIIVSDLYRMKTVQTLEGHSGAVVTFALHNELIVSAGGDKTIRLWNIRTGECLSVLRGHSRGILCLDFSENGEYIVSGSVDKSVRIWNHSELITTLPANSHRSCAQFMGNKLVSGDGRGYIKVWNLNNN